MTKVETDERGRITLPPEVRKQHGEEYRLVELQSSIKLVPVPDDPVETLRSAASEEWESASLEDLRAVELDVARNDTNPDWDDK